MIASRHIYCMARITLQAASAHGIHSGMGDATHDVLLVRDANGLPTLPGTSLAGVLRHSIAATHNKETEERLFGRGGNHAQVSWTTVSWGQVHNSNNQPCEGLLTEAQLRDPLLERLLDGKPLVRQRVSLNHRGTAKDTGKFDVTLIPAGVRYTAFIGYWCDGSEQSRDDWEKLLNLLTNQELHLGHATRSGYGQFTVQSLHHAEWDLKSEAGHKAYCQRPRTRNATTGLNVRKASPVAPLHVALTLQAEAGWRVGGGEHSLNRHDKEPDMLPQHEWSVSWNANKATISAHSYLLPGSAVKGALRHRLAFHYYCLKQQFADNLSDFEINNCQAVNVLFGSAEEDQGQAGLLRFSDLQLPASKTSTSVLMHNRIDRFTGGVMNGALFSEEVLWQTPLQLKIAVLPKAEKLGIDPDIRQALQLTLEDLANGWLPLGAGGSRGLGVFSDPSGTGPNWSDQGQFINKQQEASA